MTMLSEHDLGHWTLCKDVKGATAFKDTFDQSKYFGFLYCIKNNTTGQFYIGKKQFFHGGRKKSKTYGKEMTWRTYQGSSSHVKDDIRKLGHDKFTFEMIDLYRTKGGLYYAEAWTQMVSDAMTRTLDGKTPESYNKQIAAIRFVPRESPKMGTRKYAVKL